MRRVANVLTFISPATWIAALVVAAVGIAGALFLANRIASTEQRSFPQSAMTLPEPGQTSNLAAKAAREPFKQARLAPDMVSPSRDDPSRLAAPRQAPQGDASRVAAPRQAPREAPQDDESGAPVETGRASWYDFETKTASGETMDGDALTAAHRSLPFGSKVRVANLDNGREVVVRINDRGPFSKGRIIDVSRAAAERLGMIRAGVARVSVNPVDDEVASAGDETPTR